MVDRHLNAERHRGLVPTNQLGGAAGTVGWVLSDDGAGFGAWIASSGRVIEVTVASVANINIAGGDLDGPSPTVDGVGGLGAGDRVLVKDQTDAKENGVYRITAGAPVRAADQDTGAEIWHAIIAVQFGVVNANSLWRNTNATAPTIGVTNITYGGLAGTLARVLVAGNDPGGTPIHAADDGSSIGADLSLTPGIGTLGGFAGLKGGNASGGAVAAELDVYGGQPGGGGPLEGYAGSGPAGDPGGDILFYGGTGNAGADDSAGIELIGGSGAGTTGRAKVWTDGTNGASGDVLTSDGTYATWQATAGGPPSGAAGGDLSGTYPNPAVVNSSHDHDATTAPGDPHTALRGVDFLVGTATAELSAEIVVGASPGGELGGTWASPTVDATHSGSAHHAAVTVGTGLDVTGQLVELDLSEVASGGELGGFMDAPTVDATHSGSAHHDAVTVGTGLDVTGQLVELDLSEVAAGGELAGFMDAPTVDATHSGSAHHDPVTVGTGLDLTGQLVDLDLSEVAAGGELGGFMDAPTVDATHSGSSHAGVVSTHEAAADPHTGYVLESLLDAKGDLIAASADNTPAKVTVGADDTILMADASAGAGLKWVASGTPSTQAFGDVAAVGTADTFTRGDHKHAMMADPSGSLIAKAFLDAKGDLISASADNTPAILTVGANDTILMADSAAAAGLKWVASDTPSTQAFGDTAAVGTADTFTRGDHKHAWPSFATNAIILGSAAAAGAATTPFRSNDTIAAFDATVPTTQAFSDAAAVGTAAFAARRDHKHAMPALGTGATNAAAGDDSRLSDSRTPVSHGASLHTDITRNVFLAAAQAKLDSATAANVGASPDLTGVVAYADAATQGAIWTFEVPDDWTSGVITLQPVWSPGSTDAVAHTVRWSIVAKAVAAGSTVTAAGTTVTFTGSSAARTAGVVVYDTATSTTLTPAAAGDLFRFTLRRIGADGADSYVGVVNLLGVIVTYTANQ